ncbi:uncharacterized protein LOC114722900 [Neltuma alba]|uniref:uncharacterized protein LOC114722900 n=1 Tax=Neltuma alba TaxID=207710 RepID=UPI0010A4CD73|nr:uncharacterized protein LOC114722900 [Prosopis alba]
MNHSKTGASLSSSTRLSASAKPFTLNRSTQQSTLKFPVHSGQEHALYSPDHGSSDPFGSLLDSFPKFNLAAKGNPVFSSPLGDSGFGHEAVSAAFPIEPVSQTQADEESLLPHPSMDFQGNDDFVDLNEWDLDMPKELPLPLPVYCSNITGLGSGTCTGYEINHGNQGKDSYESLFGIGKDDDGSTPNGSISRKGKMQGGAKPSSVLRSNSDDHPFIFSTSDMSSSAEVNNVSHCQGCHKPSGVTRSASISSGIPDGRYFSEISSSTSNIASDSTGSLRAEIHGPSSHCSILLPSDSSKNMDLLTGSWGTVDDKDCSSSILSGSKDSFTVFNAEGKGTDDGDTEKPKKIFKSVSFDARGHSTITTNQVMLKSDESSGGVSIQTSKSLGDSDSDLDSPCWKGKMTSQSSSEILGSVQTHDFEKELKKSNTLNPLAPQFFPGNAEGSSRLGGKMAEDDLLSSKSSAPLAVHFLPAENKQTKTVMADAHPVGLKGVELLHSNNLNESVKAFNLVSDPKGCSKETKDDMTMGSLRGFLPLKYHSPTSSSSSSEAGLVTKLFETLQGVSKSLIDSPKLDVQKMINGMLILSELLLQSCVHTLDSHKQHDHNTIQHIINNLNEFSAIYSGLMISAVQSTGLDLRGRSLELPKHSGNLIEEANVETFAIPTKLHNQNDNGLRSNVSKVIAERGQYSVRSSSDVGPEKENEVFQVIRRNLGKNLDAEEHLHSQAMLYKNLWLDAEAAMCYMRRKIYLRLMETGMDVNHADLVDLWR